MITEVFESTAPVSFAAEGPLRSGPGSEIQSFEELMRVHAQRLYRISRAILRSNEAAEQLVQDTYVRAFGNRHQLPAGPKIATWLIKIAICQGLARSRSEPGNDPCEISAPATLADAVDSLPTIYRTVFVLRCAERLSASQTADCLASTEEAVKMRLHRARTMLRPFGVSVCERSAAEAFVLDNASCSRLINAVLARLQS